MILHFASRLLWPAALLCLAGCASTTQVISPRLPAEDSAKTVELSETPFFSQQAYQCGPAALAMVLNTSGLSVTPDDLVDKVFMPARKGSLQIELLAATRRYGRLPYVIDPDPGALLSELRNDRPVLVLQNLGIRSIPIWHYAVVIGYQAKGDLIFLRSGTTRRLSMPAARFLRTWHNAGYWGMVALPAGEFPAQANARRYLAAAADLESIGQLEAALATYRAASQRWPEQNTAWLGLGNSLYALHRLPEAELAYRALLERAPDDPIAHNNLAQTLADRGCTAQALTVLDAALSRVEPATALQAQLQQTRREIQQAAKTSPPCNP